MCPGVIIHPTRPQATTPQSRAGHSQVQPLRPPTHPLQMPPTTCTGHLWWFRLRDTPCMMMLCPMASPPRCRHPRDTGSPALCPHCRAHFAQVTSSASSTRSLARAPRGLLLLLPWVHGPPSPLLHLSTPSPAVQEEDGRALGERPGWGQEGRVPVGRPPVCPRLILAAFSVAWQSGPVAPAVILRFLGHCHTGSAAKWGAGGAGTASRAKGREGDVCWQRGRDGGVCTRRQECAGVCLASFLPTSGSAGRASALDHGATEYACGL